MKIQSLIFILSFFVFNMISYGQQPTPPNTNEETVKISTNLIQLDVVVTDKLGKAVTNLRPEDFRVYQDGKLQTITNLSYVNSQTAEKTAIFSSKENRDKNAITPPPTNVRAKQGRLITFVLDDGNCLSTFGGLSNMRDSMQRFVDRDMQPDDRVAIYRTESGVSLLQGYTSDKEILKKKIEKISLVSSFGCSSAFDSATNNATGKGEGQFESKRDKDFKDASNAEQINRKVIGTLGVLDFVVDRLMSVPQRKIIFLISEELFCVARLLKMP